MAATVRPSFTECQRHCHDSEGGMVPSGSATGSPHTPGPILNPRLITLLPPGPPHRRLEAFLAQEAVLSYVRTIGRPVALKPADALRIQTAAMLRGVCLPLLAIRSAIDRLMAPPH